jgi:trans-aconitate methyltransferase
MSKQQAASKKWNALSYDAQMNFVSAKGKQIFELLYPQPQERILDLGCGTGDLTNQLWDLGSDPTGMDFSHDMVAQAALKYPQIKFVQGDGQRFQFDQPFDAVFSNAALHWMKDAKSAAGCIYASLKTGGRFVAEFGGHGNVAVINNGIQTVLHSKGLTAASPWYFPTIGEYTSLLEEAGFEVSYAQLYSRPTPLNGGEQGLRIWLETFADHLFDQFSKEEKQSIYKRIEEQIKPSLWKEGRYVADYRRIQIIAYK